MPNRLRSVALFALILALSAPQLASAQGRGGPGGGNQGGGGRGGPGGGRGGPGGMSPTNLITMPVVQDEIKMTDKQKDQVKLILAEADKRRTQVRDNATKMAAVANEQAAVQAAQAAAMAQANAVAQANKAAQANAFAPTSGFGTGNTANQGQITLQGQMQNQGGRGGRTNGRNSAGNQVMQQAMTNFESQVETTVLKAVEPKQRTRIKQIALQAEGAGAFNNPEVIQALGMTQDQVMAIEGIRNDSRRAQGALMGELFTAMRGNNDNNGGGNNGGRGRGGRPDPATFQTPEFQAKFKTVQENREKLDDQTMAAVGKALTKAQRSKFNSMIGEKFDVAKLRQGFMDRFRPNGAAPGADAPATADTTKPAATPAAPTPEPAEAAKTAAPTRGSLRASRSGNP